MEEKSSLAKAIRDIKMEIKAVKEEAKSTVEEIRETIREVLPRPLRKTVRSRIGVWRKEKWES